MVRALRLITCGAAASLGMPYGRLHVGGPADVVVFAPDMYWKVDASTLLSQGKNTPFAGYELRGRVRKTLVAGVVVHSE